MTKKIISEYFSEMAKKRHRENPMPKEHYSAMGKKSKRKSKKLSPDIPLQ